MQVPTEARGDAESPGAGVTGDVNRQTWVLGSAQVFYKNCSILARWAPTAFTCVTLGSWFSRPPRGSLCLLSYLADPTWRQALSLSLQLAGLARPDSH